MKNKTTYVSVSLLFDEVCFHKTVPSTHVYRNISIHSLKRLMRTVQNGRNDLKIDYHTQELDIFPVVKDPIYGDISRLVV